MTLDEAIRYCDEKAKEPNCKCKACAEEHIQLRDWLVELRQRRNESGYENTEFAS